MEDSLGTIIKLLVYLDGAMALVWFGVMFLAHFFEGIHAMGPAKEDDDDRRYMIGRFIRAIIDVVIVILAVAVVYYVHTVY